jgi:hypothetical protein
MLFAGAALWCALSLSPAVPTAGASRGAARPMTLATTFQILNPGSVGGHRILHLEDVIGPRRRSDVPGLPSARAVLVFTTGREACGAVGLCAEVERLTAPLRQAGALVVAVALVRREESAALVRDLSQRAPALPVALEEHGVVGRTLGLDRPGLFVILDHHGEPLPLPPPPDLSDGELRGRHLGELRRMLEAALERDDDGGR